MLICLSVLEIFRSWSCYMAPTLFFTLFEPGRVYPLFESGRGKLPYTLGGPLLGDHQEIVTFCRKLFWWHIFFTFHIHIFVAFWFMVVSFQLLKLWPFFEGRCSPNDDFMVKTLSKRQILVIAVKYEQLKIYTWNFVRILVFIRVLCL